jgi:integrase/recombinase XerD
MTEQLPLFQRKTFPVTLTQGAPILPPAPEKSILSTLPAYRTYLQSTVDSVYTPSDFCGDIKKFGLFVRNKPVQEIVTLDIQQWLAQLRTTEHLTEKTISRKLSALNNYFTWLVIENVLSANPAMAIPNHKVTSPLPIILFEVEYNRLLEGASHDPRTYLLVLLLLETGMKTEELLNLELSHIDTSNAYAPEVEIRHSGKKIKKDRKLKLPREIGPVLSDYVATYRITKRVFPYTSRFLQKELSDLGKEIGLMKSVSLHMLRDTCAVRWLRQGVDIETVLMRLGLSESTWEDAKVKYVKLASRGI